MEVQLNVLERMFILWLITNGLPSVDRTGARMVESLMATLHLDDLAQRNVPLIGKVDPADQERHRFVLDEIVAKWLFDQVNALFNASRVPTVYSRHALGVSGALERL